MNVQRTAWLLTLAGGALLAGCGSAGKSGDGIAGRTGGAAQQEDDRPVVVRRIGQAVELADAALMKEYGPEAAAAQRPLQAFIMDQNHWIVTGNPVNGKVAEVRLRVTGGSVVSVRMLPADEVKKRLPTVRSAPADGLGYYE